MKNLDRFLLGVSDVEFHELELRLQIGRLLRDAEIKYEQTMAQMAKRLGLNPIGYLRWRKGAMDFSLRQIAEINVILGDLIRQEAMEKDLIRIKLDEEKKK